MSNTLSPELKKQIEQEAEAYANSSFFGRYFITPHAIKSDNFKAGARKYALKWEQAEFKIERYEKALKEIIALRRPLNDDTAVLIALQTLNPNPTTNAE